MASSTKTIEARIEAKDNASGSISKVKAELNKLRDKNINVNVDTSGAESKISSIAQKINSIGKGTSGGLTGILSKAGPAGLAIAGVTAAVAGLGAALGAAGDKFIGYNAKMEQTNIAFTSMLGSAQDAKIMMDQLRKFAADTPFEFEDIAPAAQQLKAFGFEARDIIPTLTAVGNASAGLGRGTEGLKQIAFVMGQIKTTGKLMGQDVMQLSQLGIPVKDILAKNLGLAADQLSDIGNQGISADAAIKALTEGMNERFPNMMDKMSNSFSGMLSTINDNASQILGKIGEPLFNSMKGAISKVRDAFDTALKNVNTKGLSHIFDDLVPKGLANHISHLFNSIGQEISAIMPVIDNLSSALGDLFKPLLEGDGSLFLDMLDTVATVTVNVWRVVSGVIADIAAVIGSAESYIVSVLNGISGAFDTLYNGLLSGIVQMANQFLATVGDWLSQAYNAIVDFVNACLDKLGVVGTAIRKIASMVGATIDSAKDAVTNSKTFQALTNLVTIDGNITSKVETGPTDFVNQGGGAVGGGGSVGGSGGGGAGAVDKAQKKIEELTKKIADAVSDLSDKILDETGTAYEKGIGKLNSEIAKVKKEIEEATAAGVNTDALQAKLEEYGRVIKDKLVKKWKEANTDLVNDTNLALAKMTKSISAQAEAQYQIDLEKLKREKENKLKEVALTQDSVEAKLAVERWYNAQLALITKQRDDELAKEPKTWSEAWNTALQQMVENFGSKGKQMQDAMNSVASSMADGFTDMFTDVLTLDFKNIGSSFSNMLKSMLKAIASFMAKQVVTSFLSRFLGGGGGGLGTGISLGGSFSQSWGDRMIASVAPKLSFRANGGPVSAGQAYIVGERRPELFVPRTSGTIIPSVNVGRQAPEVQVVVQNNTGTPMQAKTQTMQQSDGRVLKTIILQTIANAVYTNEDHMRDVIAGVRGG